MRVFIAGGGTGGHLFPALEFANILKSLGPEITFLGVKKGLEAKRVPAEGYKIEFIPFEGVRGRGIKALKAFFKFPFSLVKTLKIFKREKPDLVICTGGYTSFPAGFSAFISGVPLFLHEQNIVPGWSNLVLSYGAKAVMVSFEESMKCFRIHRVFHTGNAIRGELVNIKLSFPSFSHLALLVIGGSRGARTINDTVSSSFSLLAPLSGVKLIHQTGEVDYPWVSERYGSVRQEVEVIPFIDNMVEAYKKAHLVISRAGATTLFELSAVGRAAVLIPYPYAVGDHQKKNAQVLVKKKAAIVIDNWDFNRENFIKVITKFYFNRKLLIKMAKNMRGSLKSLNHKEVKKILGVSEC